uniref:zinc finger protein 37-like n=1 Tax=Semicossyphus pulcher TaxID=241346 RepID=UPI0037E8D6BE
MEDVNVIFVTSVDPNLSKAEILRGVVSEKLTTVAREIFAAVERTVAGYEEEAAGLREVIVRQRNQLEAVLQPQVTLFRIDGPVCEPQVAERDGEDSGSWDDFGPIEDEEAEDEWEEPVQNRPRKWDYITLRVCLLQDFKTNKLSNCVLKTPVQEVRCRRGLMEADFLDILRSTFPHLTGQFDTFTVDSSRTLTQLKLKKLIPEEIQAAIKSRGKGRSALYIRGKATNDPLRSPSPPPQLPPPQRKEHATSNRRNRRKRTRAMGSSLKRRRSKGHLLNLRVCLLKDSKANMLKRGVLKSQLKELRCPRGLQETEFLNMLRSSFPQLTRQFDAFTTDSTRRLTPLKLQTLTPEKIERTIKSRGKGRSALYIRVKAAKESLSSMEPLPPSRTEDNAIDDTRNDEKGAHASFHNSPVEEGESNESRPVSSNSGQQQQTEAEEDAEKQGISGDSGALSSAGSSSEIHKSDVDDEAEKDDGDEEWKPDETDEMKPEPDSSKKRRRVKHSGVKTKRRKRILVSTPLSCKVCQALSGSKNMLIKHSWIHVDDPERLCGVCGEHSESTEVLRSHLESHQKIQSCKICKKSFLSLGGLKRHATLHTGEKPYRCDICNKAYACKNSLRSHRWEHVENKQHNCDVCHQSFAFKQQLRIHSRTHTGENPYSCDVCGKSVSGFRSLSRHKLTHFGVKRYGCKVCGKRFLTHKNVKEHEKIHTDRDKPYLCDICCKLFHTQSQLKVHLRTHSEEKIICSQCGKGLSSQGALKRHMVTHTGERPYKCSECGRTYASSSALRVHLKAHSGIKPYVCGVCGKASYRKAHLIVHMRTHNGEKPYKCSICDKGFTQSHCLKTHMKSHQREGKTAGDDPGKS